MFGWIICRIFGHRWKFMGGVHNNAYACSICGKMKFVECNCKVRTKYCVPPKKVRDFEEARKV